MSGDLAVRLNIAGNDLGVISDVLLLLASQTEADSDIRESCEVPESVQLDILSNAVFLLGDSIAAYSANRSAAVPPGQFKPELALLDIIAGWLDMIASAIAIQSAEAAYREGMAGDGG